MGAKQEHQKHRHIFNQKRARFGNYSQNSLRFLPFNCLKKPKKMEMKKIACAVLVAAASMSAVLAESPAPAPEAASSAYAALPTVGTIVGASLASFFAYYMH